jgi:glucose/arabinose dehydrogenase
MTRARVIVGRVVAAGVVLMLLGSLARGQGATSLPVDPRGIPQGGRGGFNNAAAQLYIKNCQGCHGSDLAGGRAPSLFEEKWLASTKDNEISNSVRNGVAGTEMGAFKDKLDDDQIATLIKYIRTQSGVFKPKPVFVADPNGTVLKTEKQTVRLEVIARNLDTPWGLAFLPDGRILVTERTINHGTLRIIDKGVLSPPLKGTPVVYVAPRQQDAGMFDVIVHPHYAANGWIYLAYASELPGNVAPTTAPAIPPGRGAAPAPTMTNIVRGRLSKDNEWIDQQFIFQAPASMYTNSGIHYGCRFTFDKEGHLFYSLGERGVMQNAQDLSNPLGKVHRVNDDGSVPKDNPFFDKPGADPTIWTYGNRNPQGFGWDPVSGRLWESEHGPIAGDEINILRPGHNYGWGVVSKGTQPGITKTSAPGMDDPIVYYTPTFAPSGMTFYSGDKFPAWKNNLFVGGLAGQALRRLEIDGETVTKQEVIFDQFGRVRDVVQGPDGYLYLLLQTATGAGTPYNLTAPSPGLVARLTPVQ